MSEFAINGRSVSSDSPVYVIAEMSANHHQELPLARELVHAMSESGADAVKLQTYTPDTMTLDCNKQHFRIGQGTIWEGRGLHELYDQAFTPWDWHEELFELANRLGMDCFSTPFDRSSVDFLETLNPPAYKIASFEMVDLPLIEYVAAQGRPIIMSTGMGTLEEIGEAVQIIQRAGVPLTLLKCTSAYPAPPEAMNLRTIPDLAERFGVPVGLSDHTLGYEVAVAAVALGARVIEKHFTLSRLRPGPDSSYSMEPQEFEVMVNAIRTVEKALGSVSYQRTDCEQASVVFRRSLFAVTDIESGEELTDANVRSIRPGGGLAPKFLDKIKGRPAARHIDRGSPLTWDDVT